MNLVIRAQTLKNELLSQTITGQFDERGGTIGRSDTNTLALPDPERHVSRLHAEVFFADGAFSLRNVGSANPIVVNGRPVDPGEHVVIGDGDEMVIGGYALRVELGGSSGGDSGRAAVKPRTVIAASVGEARTGPPPAPSAAGRRRPSATAPGRQAQAAPPPASDPFAGLSGIGSGAAGANDPFADLLGPRVAPAAGNLTTAPSVRSAQTPPARLPDDFDPFADLVPAPADAASGALDDFMQGRVAPAASPQQPQADDLLGPAAAPSSLDALFGLSPSTPAQGDPLADFLAPARGKGAAAAPPPLPAAFDHTPELAAAYSPPAVRAPTPPRKPAPPRAAPPPAARDPRDSASPEALWAAFCDGAGIALPLPQGLNPELMRIIGALLHHAVEGTLKLSAVRTAAKRELRAQLTTIQSRDNNPLKFAADPSAALTQLLQPPQHGFTAGPQAMHDAMDDLLGHSIGTMAATRAALQGLLRRFEPAQLETRLASHGVIDALLPMNRRAKLWELYLEHYRSIGDAAQDDFHQLFGRAFVKAYEEQIERLAAARRKLPPQSRR